MTNHSECTHEKTKAARAACRRARTAAMPHVSMFLIESAYAMNDMWETLNTRQESLLNTYDVVQTTCEYCDQERPCFNFPKINVNVCGSCERTNNVHMYEEEK